MESVNRADFLAVPRTAVLATVSAQGDARAAPVWFMFQDGHFTVLTGRNSAKRRNVTRTGRATLCIDEREEPYRYVIAEGPVTVSDTVSYDERMALQGWYRGEEAARRIVDRGGHENLVKLTLTPDRWRYRLVDEE